MRGSNKIPERCFASGSGDANPGWTTIHIVRQIRRFRMACQGPNAAHFGLCKEWIICQPVLLQQAAQGSSTTAKAQRIDGQDGHLWVDIVAWITAARILARHGLTHNHPQGIRSRDVVSASEHEFVAEWMFGLAVVIAQPA